MYSMHKKVIVYVFYFLQCIIVSMGVFLSEIAKAQTKCFNKVFLPYATFSPKTPTNKTTFADISTK
jgi:hypothetical protein